MGNFDVFNQSGARVSNQAHVCVRTQPAEQRKAGLSILNGQPGIVHGNNCARGLAGGFGEGLGRIWYAGAYSNEQRVVLHNSWINQLQTTGYLYVR